MPDLTGRRIAPRIVVREALSIAKSHESSALMRE